jgi:hypothetical protein
MTIGRTTSDRKPRLLFNHVKDIINDLYPQLKEHMVSDQPLQAQSTKFKKLLGDLRHTDNDPLYVEYCKRHQPTKRKRREAPEGAPPKRLRVEPPVLEVFPVFPVAPAAPPSRWPDVPADLQPAYDVQELLLRLTNQFTATLDHSQQLHEQLREQHALQQSHLQTVAMLKRRIGQLEQGHLRLRESEASLRRELASRCGLCS